MNILFSSCGRRVELIRYFRKAMQRLGGGKLIGIDTNPLAPALFEVDRQIIVPSCASNDYLAALLKICESEEVDVIIPLIDPELPVYAVNKEILHQIGAQVIVSGPDVIEICSDKVSTANFLQKVGLPFLMSMPIAVNGWEKQIELPAVLKPRRGSGGKDVYIVRNVEDVSFLSKTIDEPILQQRAVGQEITLDCMVGFDGQPLRIVARERLEVRAGESSKGRTIKEGHLIDLTAKLLKYLKACGPVTIQCFRQGGQYVFAEINPRFGGGYPLSHAAGADFPYILLSMCEGEMVTESVDEFEEGVYFCRFDEAFYLKIDKNDEFKRI